MLFRKLLDTCLDYLYPPRCIQCNTCLGQVSDLCSACWNHLIFVHSPLCHSCGFGLLYENEEHICHTPFNAVRFPLIYNDASKNLFMKFKYADGTGLAHVFVKWILRAIPPDDIFWHNTHTLIPVPLHRWRLFSRKYNQAALICQILQRSLPHLKIDYDTLKRKKATPPQEKLSAFARAQNVRGAFRSTRTCPPGVILVDDVYASGATLKECAKVLGSPLKVLCVARSPLPS